MKRTRDYDDWLTERLQDPQEMAAYLREHLEWSDDPDETHDIHYDALEVAVEQCIKALEEKSK